ncbi:glycosyltransferase [Beggiatoa leptomitoformis]|uniref:Glycosyltransferase n=1 Tax=Beggiatoa leptomitoformis TaxID=288004 RepID=A0A2N9YI92_9GAMM|nr:glycosyltransferase [Beggiatoa leptomitoformis]ALG67523.1 glycosyltransferase [Beggiatoa leptomitoformis]AUI70252.1 glycosyltransferase [Beggiatoa leptomitoformis]
MNILHVIANLAPRYGGPAKACFEIARAVAQRGHNVTIYTTNQDGDTELDEPLNQLLQRDGVNLRFFPIQSPRFWGTSLPMATALAHIIPNMDIVHVHSLYLFHNLVAPWLCRWYKKPYLMLPHGTLDPFLYHRHRQRKQLMEWAFENRNIRHTTAMHFITPEEQTLANPYIFNAPSVVVPLGLNLEEYDQPSPPNWLARYYPETKDKKIILFFGRIHFKKGLDLLIPAFITLAQQQADIHLVIAGPDDENYADSLKLLLQTSDMLHRVTFTGMVQGEEKLAVLRESYVFALPSYSENFGIAVLEAMACRCPVLISDKVNLHHDIQAAQAGVIVPCEQHALQQALAELLANPQQAQDYGKKGRQLVENRFQWQRIGELMAQTYQQLIDKHRVR